MGHNKKELEPTLLVVEDDDFNYFLLAKLIKKYGIYHERVKTASQAKNKILCGNNKLEYILMDAMYQTPNGFESGQLIKKLKPEIKLIAHTTYRPIATNRQEFEEVFDFILYKPSSISEIKEVLDIIANKRHFSFPKISFAS